MPYVQREGVNIFYDTYGRGMPIVFLHPFSSNRHIWLFQLFSFARDYQCILIDHRGHGQSDKPTQSYTIRAMAADVSRVLDETGHTGAVLVGNSIGGMIAMQFNLDFPDRVLGTAVIGTATNLSVHMPPETVRKFQTDLRGSFLSLMEDEVANRTSKIKPEILESIRGTFLVPNNFPEHVLHAHAKERGAVFDWDITRQLKDITGPFIAFAGAEDGAVPVPAIEFLVRNIPDAELKVVEGVGHFYQLERPADFNRDFRHFLASLSRNG